MPKKERSSREVLSNLEQNEKKKRANLGAMVEASRCWTIKMKNIRVLKMNLGQSCGILGKNEGRSINSGKSRGLFSQDLKEIEKYRKFQAISRLSSTEIRHREASL